MARDSDRLRRQFDQRLGRRSRMAREANKPKSMVAAHVTNAKNVAKSAPRVTRGRVTTGAESLPSDIKKMYQRQFGKQAAGGGKSSVASFQKTMNNIVDETVRELNKRIDTEEAILTAMNNPVPQKSGGGGGWTDFAKSVVSETLKNTPGVGALVNKPGEAPGSVGQFTREARELAEGQKQAQEGKVDYWQGLMENFSRSPAGRALDIVSRPAYGVFEGMDRALEAGYREENPDDFWHSFDDLAEGFASGVSGQEKTGFGQVWNRMRENSEMVGMEELRNLDESHPGVTRWLDRAAGFGGEVAFDPTNWVTGGTAGIIRNTGQQLTESTAKAAVRETVETATRDFFDEFMDVAATRGMRYKPSREALAAYAAQVAEDTMEKNLLEIHAGTHAGWNKMGSVHTAASVANRVTEEVRSQIYRSFDNRVDKVVEALQSGGNLPIRAWRTHLAQSPELEDMVDTLMRQSEEAANAAGKAVPWNTRDEFIATLTKRDLPRIRKAAVEVRSQLDSPLSQHIYDEVFRNTRELYYNTIGIRVGKKTIPIKTIGKAYAYTKENLPARAKAGVDNFAASASYERNFPGRISLLTQANRSVGAKAFEDFHSEWMKIARDFTQEEDQLLFKALQDPTVVLPPKLEAMKLRIRDEFDRMFADEVAQGARPANGAGSRSSDNYVFLFTKGGDIKARTKFKNERKAAINRSGHPEGWNLERAKNTNLKPVESAFESLLARKMKSTRDITRALFMKDLVENYGIMAKPLTPAAKRLRNLVEIHPNKLPQYMREQVKKGNRFYLPETHMDMFNTYEGLSRWDQNFGRTLETINRLTNVIKYLSTVPRPGFHIRNMIGDLYMGILDGIPTRAYSEVFAKWRAHQAGKPVSFRITKNMSKSWDEMKALYDTHANSGFFETEIPLGGSSPSAGQHLSNARKRIANRARKVSDMREDYGRFVHFVSAYRQEMNALIKKGVREGIEDKALEAAVWRVNHYKFDYGALTAAERRVKLLFPFYTFSRKAVPTLLQQLYLNPKWMSLPNRFMTYNDGSAADKFNHYFLPDYVRDMGYAMLTNEEEPLFMTQDILPTTMLNSIDFTNSQQFAQSIGSQFNPLAQIPFEVALNRQVFSERPTGSFPEYIMNKFAVPGQFAQQAFGNDPDPLWLQMLNEGWTGANIPVRRFTQGQQDFGFREMEDRFIQDPFQDFNRSQDKYRVYQSNRANGTSFRVVDMATDEVLYETMNPNEALAYAQKLR